MSLTPRLARGLHFLSNMWCWLEKQSGYFVATYKKWGVDDGWLMAAAVAYYVGLSFFPMLLLLIAGVGLFMRFTDSGGDAQQAVVFLVRTHLSESAATQILQALDQVRENSFAHGPIAFIVTFFSSMAGFVQLERAFDRIRNGDQTTAKKGILSSIRMVLFERLVAFIMLCAIAVLIVAVFIVGIVLSAIRAYSEGILPGSGVLWRWVQIFASFAVNAGLFTLIYRWLPDPQRPVPLKYAFRGGIVAAAIWEIGRQILGAVLIGSKYTIAYGVVGSFIAVMLWSYYGIAVLLLGAEYIQVACGPDRRPEGSNPASAGERGAAAFLNVQRGLAGIRRARASTSTNGTASQIE